MGAVSTLFLLDVVAVRERVVPGLRLWISTGEVAPWWGGALQRAQAPTPDPADRVAWQDEASDRGRRWAAGMGWAGGLSEPHRPLDEDTLQALEVALLTASVGHGLAFGNARWLSIDLVDPDDGVMDLVPSAGSPLVEMLERLDSGLQHVALATGGYGEGLRGALDEADTAELDRQLARCGSRPALGGPLEFRGAMAATPAEPPHLQAARSTLVALHSMAHRASRLGFGLLHGRDLTLHGMGRWQSGVFVRDVG